VAPAIAGALVTPVVLTFNEEPNIERSLASLAWARDVVVLDSGSTDATEAIARSFSNVRWHTRTFDRHGAQWEHAIRSTGIATKYVLALDADYAVPEAFVRELEQRYLPGEFDGGIAGFEYRLLGRSLMGSVYPAKAVIFRPSRLTIAQPGHTQEMHVDGSMYRFAAKLIHDDRKPPARFVRSQIEYARLEAERLRSATSLRWQDRVRRLGLMPPVAGLAAYLRAGGPLRGRASLRYAYERTLFECLLAMHTLAPQASRAVSRTLVQAHARETAASAADKGK
jgi:glycosyltransferase involved in cell wall biosynthesis